MCADVDLLRLKLHICKQFESKPPDMYVLCFKDCVITNFRHEHRTPRCHLVITILADLDSDPSPVYKMLEKYRQIIL